MTMWKCVIAIGVYLLSVFVFFFIANIVCTLADFDKELLILFSFVWPITIVCMAFLLVFFLIETASDYIADKLYDFMCECKHRKNDKANK